MPKAASAQAACFGGSQGRGPAPSRGLGAGEPPIITINVESESIQKDNMLYITHRPPETGSQCEDSPKYNLSNFDNYYEYNIKCRSFSHLVEELHRQSRGQGI